MITRGSCKPRVGLGQCGSGIPLPLCPAPPADNRAYKRHQGFRHRKDFERGGEGRRALQVRVAHFRNVRHALRSGMLVGRTAGTVLGFVPECPSLTNGLHNQSAYSFIPFILLGCVAMMLIEAQKYHAYARECLQQAERAERSDVRERLIELSRAWMEAALTEEKHHLQGMRSASAVGSRLSPTREVSAISVPAPA